MDQEGFEMGFFGQRFSRASASERRRRSRSASLSLFGTPLAMRPRAAAALFISGNLRPFAIPLFHQIAQFLPARLAQVRAIGKVRGQLPALKRARATELPIGFRIYASALFSALHPYPVRLHRAPPFCGVSHLVESKVTDNRFPVNRENATIFRVCLPNMDARRFMSNGGNIMTEHPFGGRP
jgi:hypothetical protein